MLRNFASTTCRLCAFREWTAAADWQREPLRITFHPAGREAISYDIVPGSVVLVEETPDEDKTPAEARTD